MSSVTLLQVTSVGYQMETNISDLKSNTNYLISVFARGDIGNEIKSTRNATIWGKGVYNVLIVFLS